MKWLISNFQFLTFSRYNHLSPKKAKKEDINQTENRISKAKRFIIQDEITKKKLLKSFHSFVNIAENSIRKVQKKGLISGN